MAKKFDTNPLDPEFPEKVKETQKELQTVALPKTQNGKTRRFAEPVATEEQTRQFNGAEFDAYQAPAGNESRPPAAYEPRSIYKADADVKKTHNIGSISLPENVLMALPYIPFAYIGIIAGVIELIFIPKSEPRVRYHAAQGMAAQIGVLIVMTVLGFFSWTDLASTASWIFSLITTIMLLVFAVKAWQGKPIHIETVQDLTDWLEDKIKPQK
jgi:uncharacterized membrane protein